MSFSRREAEAREGKKPTQSPRKGGSGRAEGGPRLPPLPRTHPPPHAVSPGSCSHTPAPDAHLKGAQPGCDLAQDTGKKISLGQGERGGVFPLALMAIKCRHCSLPSHRRLCLPFLTSRPFPLPLFALETAKTRPWLPAGPEAEVTSPSLERLWGWKTTASTPPSQFIALKHEGPPSGSRWTLKNCLMSQGGWGVEVLRIIPFYTVGLRIIDS